MAQITIAWSTKDRWTKYRMLKLFQNISLASASLYFNFMSFTGWHKRPYWYNIGPDNLSVGLYKLLLLYPAPFPTAPHPREETPQNQTFASLKFHPSAWETLMLLLSHAEKRNLPSCTYISWICKKKSFHGFNAFVRQTKCSRVKSAACSFRSTFCTTN